MKKIILFVSLVLGFLSIVALSSCKSSKDEEVIDNVTITFDTVGGPKVSSITVVKGSKALAPDDPKKDGYTFAGWYTDKSYVLDKRFSFENPILENITLYAKWTENVSVLTNIMYKNNQITLSKNALYVDATLKDDQLGQFSFKTIQSAVLSATSGTKETPTVIYLAPDVYWTDDYTKEEIRQKDDLIGLTISQSNITLIGLTGNSDDVVIASDRGQNAGANGNFNTIAIGDGFSAYGVTFGNYCNIDLDYALDPTKNHTKRQTAITQAQVITKAPSVEVMDRWYFENCQIVSRLNVFSRDERPYRTYIKNSRIECNDDSLGTGYITIFENCDIELYSNHPSGGASHYMQAYLNCRFTTNLAGDDKTIYICKNTKPFAFIDCSFDGDLTGVEWKSSNISNNIKNIVYNNTINGKELVISPNNIDASVTPSEKLLEAFKVNGEYNIYNLLNCDSYDEWDPSNQKSRLESYINPWNIQFAYDGMVKDVTPLLEGNEVDSLVVNPIVLGGSKDEIITWSVSDIDLMFVVNSDNTVTVTAKNSSEEVKTIALIATMDNGLTGVLHFDINPSISSAPEFIFKPQIGTISDGKIIVEYELNKETNDLNPDQSLVYWYRSPDENIENVILVGVSRYVKQNDVPYIEYVLSRADIGYYIVCSVSPQLKYSKLGQPVYTNFTDSKIKLGDVLEDKLNTIDLDFTNMTYINAIYDESNEWTNDFASGYWYGGYYLPSEYKTGGEFDNKAYTRADEQAYTYSSVQIGTNSKYGMQTTTQGARMVYADSSVSTNMNMEVSLSPHKTGAQGFGSARQFLDIYIKYDVKTMTGYGLRIERTDSTSNDLYKDYLAKSCLFTLVSYENGVATKISESIFSTAFLPDCTVKLDFSNGILSANVTTLTPQDSAYPEYMVHEVNLSSSIIDNGYSGFGFQHTGTAGAGKSGNRTTIHNLKVKY